MDEIALKPRELTLSDHARDKIRLALGRAGADRYTANKWARRIVAPLEVLTPAGDVTAWQENMRDARNADSIGGRIVTALGNAAIIAMGALGVGAAKKSITIGHRATKLNSPAKKSLAQTSASLHDPPVKPPRDFALDYPNGVEADVLGRPLKDIDGRPLGARFIAGRTSVGAVDTRIPEEAYDTIAEATTGRYPEVVPPSSMGRAAGRYYPRQEVRSRADGRVIGVVEPGIKLAGDLTPKHLPRVLAHEIGHAIDDIAKEIPVNGLSRELGNLYNTGKTGWERRRHWTTPESEGYKPGNDSHRELIAEAIRAYMTDPNYIKTVAPKTAARIRQFVNDNPKLKSVIQFNSVAGVTVGLGKSVSSDDADREQPAITCHNTGEF